MNDTERSEGQAKAQLSSIREMVAALECDYERLAELREARGHSPLTWATENPDDAEELAELEAAAGECADRDEAEQRITEDALSVEVRTDWYSPGAEPEPAAEFQILLCTGGPACRIVGELRDGVPYRAWLEHQDWGTPWTEYHGEAASDALCAYAGCFYFGE